ncbi:MAG TPA: hypothetical protein VGS80_26820, partial [Ktedonobacterales bacterium]|nr:hypothetical protein [Ktedonobacterales bacterium]
MIEGQQRVRFAAAKVGLQINDGIAAGAAQALQSVGQQPAQPMCEEGALEEVARDAVFIGASAAMHLAQVGGEFGEEVAARGDIRLGRHDFAPGTQTHAWFAFDGGNSHLARLIAHLF